MIILGIESSCDETAAAIVENGIKVLSSVVSSSEELQKKWGGIMPEQAAREQIKCIIPVIDESIKNSKLKIKNLEVIAVTIGPGLIGSLLIGIETAKTLSLVFQKPIIPVNHLIGHIYANFVNSQSAISNQQSTINNLSPKSDQLTHNQHIINNQSTIRFPCLCLIASGGHTELVLMPKHGDYQVVGQTLDDAAGECFDKCARLLGLGYPGGPAIEQAAKKISHQSTHDPNQRLVGLGPKHIINNSLTINLPRPMINDKSFNFSFSGLKTAVLYTLKRKNQYNNIAIQQYNNLLAHELQEAITDVLVIKTLRAAEKFQVKSILVGGGVASNQRLRDKLQLTINQLSINNQLTIQLCFPDKKLCTDNAIGIASSAFFNYHPLHWSKLQPNPSLEIT